MQLIQIKEGLNLSIINTKKFKTNCIAILIKTKLDKKTVTYNAILPIILSIGNFKYKSIREINLKTEKMNGSEFYTDILKKGDFQILEFFIEYINFTNQEEVFSFLADIILNPFYSLKKFEDNHLETAKSLLKDKIQMSENDKRELAKNKCIEYMFKEESFGIFADGYIKDLDNINSENLFDYYKNLLKEAEINIIMLGDILKTEATYLAQKYFDIKDRSFKNIKSQFLIEERQKTNNIIEIFDITQGKICLAYRTNISTEDELFFALLVANEILGGGAFSKLFNNIREKESLCYYINSFLFMFKGVIFIQAGIDFKEYENVLSKIQNEVLDIKKGNFTEEDIKNAIKSLEKRYLSISDYNTSMMDYYFSNYLANIKLNIDEIIQKIENVSKEDIKKAFFDIWLDTTYFMKGEKNDK